MAWSRVLLSLGMLSFSKATTTFCSIMDALTYDAKSDCKCVDASSYGGTLTCSTVVTYGDTDDDVTTITGDFTFNPCAVNSRGNMTTSWSASSSSPSFTMSKTYESGKINNIKLVGWLDDWMTLDLSIEVISGNIEDMTMNVGFDVCGWDEDDGVYYCGADYFSELPLWIFQVDNLNFGLHCDADSSFVVNDDITEDDSASSSSSSSKMKTLIRKATIPGVIVLVLFGTMCISTIIFAFIKRNQKSNQQDEKGVSETEFGITDLDIKKTSKFDMDAENAEFEYVAVSPLSKRLSEIELENQGKVNRLSSISKTVKEDSGTHV